MPASEETMAGNGKMVVFRADAGTGIGGGHIMRCLSLADALADCGFTCVFAVCPDTVAAVPALRNSGFVWAEVTCPSDQEPGELQRIWPDGCDLLVVDHYNRDARFETSCRAWALRILVIDDLADRKHDCDYLLDSSPGASEEDYQGLVPHECRLLIGPKYALLRPELVYYRKKRFFREPLTVGIKQVFACFGLLDGRRLLPDTIDTVCLLNSNFKVDAVVGSAASHIDMIRRHAAKQGKRVRLRIDASSVPEIMSEADLGIGAAGGMALERCCLGLPSIVVPTAQNQKRNAEALHALGAVATLKLSKSFPDELAEMINHLAANPGQLQQMATRSSAVCDGKGILRLLLELQSLFSTDEGIRVRLKLAGMDDAETIFAWQKNPEARVYFRNPAVPSWEEHRRWMEDSVWDADRFLFLIEASGKPAGVLRLDREERGGEFQYEVSILVAPDLQGSGIGKAALRNAQAVFPRHRLRAEVSSRNVASQRLFRSAGFKKIVDKRPKDVFELEQGVQGMEDYVFNGKCLN